MTGILAVLLVLASAIPALAVECRSVRGHVDRQPVTAERRAELRGDTLHLDGRFEGGTASTRLLPCRELYPGILCTQMFGSLEMTVTTSRNQMIETVTERATGRELANIAYQCSGALTLRRRR